MKTSFALLLTLLLSSTTFTQPFYRTLSIPVSKDNVVMKNPWVGGMDAPQFSPADFDSDGKQDLFVFDRNGNKPYTFLNKGNGNYSYSPFYEKNLPEIENWALMRDFNKDGTSDLFCWANGGMKVYKGKRTPNGIEYELMTNLLTFTNYFSSNYPEVNIYVLTDDIPGLIDVNGDGDLDILAFGNFATSVEYYENQSIEQGKGLDTLIFDSYNLDLCWGKFFESGIDNSISLASCKTGGMSESEAGRHAGSTICVFDKDGDGDKDLLLGDIVYNTMIYLENGGDSIDANMVTYDSIFPSYNISINMPVFPAAYIFDADDDGKNDLLVSPNARGAYRNIKNVMWYKNVGSNSNYDFRYQTDSFLVNEILDFGTNAKVTVFDYNGDGLLDILIGNDTYYLTPNQNSKSQLALLENIGTSTNPSFKLVTTDYANISSYLLRQLQPAFGDLDGDGKSDMLLGDASGYLHFFKNTGSSTANFSALTTPQYFNIDASVLAAPFIYDIDADGDNDLIVGRRDGTINWYINYGNKTSPQFSKDSLVSNFGKIALQGQYEIEGCAQPVLYKSNDSTFLITGSNRGTVFKYYVPSNQLRGGTFALMDSNLLNTDVGQKATVGMADFNGDGKLDFLVGNSMGGLNFFSSTPIDNPNSTNDFSTEKPSWLLYPNPAQNEIFISISNKQQTDVELYSSIGNLILKERFTGVTSISTEAFATGFYILKINQEGYSDSKKLLINH